MLKSNIHINNDASEMVHTLSQPTEDIILARNAELRKNPSAIRDLGEGTQSWGRMVATVPDILMHKATLMGFDIYNKDAKWAAKEMMRFLKETPEGRACLIRDTTLKTQKYWGQS